MSGVGGVIPMVLDGSMLVGVAAVLTAIAAIIKALREKDGD